MFECQSYDLDIIPMTLIILLKTKFYVFEVMSQLHKNIARTDEKTREMNEC